MELPIYCIVGIHPVKAIETEDGGMSIQAYNQDTGKFERRTDLLTTVIMGDDDVDYMSEEEFNQYIEKLHQRATDSSK